MLRHFHYMGTLLWIMDSPNLSLSKALSSEVVQGSCLKIHLILLVTA